LWRRSSKKGRLGAMAGLRAAVIVEPPKRGAIAGFQRAARGVV
jgi:hypothetical protein